MERLYLLPFYYLIVSDTVGKSIGLHIRGSTLMYYWFAVVNNLR